MVFNHDMSTNNTPRTNRYAATCKACNTTVAPGAGHITGKSAKGWEITHTDVNVCDAAMTHMDYADTDDRIEALYDELMYLSEQEGPEVEDHEVSIRAEIATLRAQAA